MEARKALGSFVNAPDYCIEGMTEECRGTTCSRGAGNVREKSHGGFLLLRTLVVKFKNLAMAHHWISVDHGLLWIVDGRWSTERLSRVEMEFLWLILGVV
jgi:hypothetical protein